MEFEIVSLDYIDRKNKLVIAFAPWVL